MKGTQQADPNPQGDSAPKSEKVSGAQNVHLDKEKEGSTEGSDTEGSPLPNSTSHVTGVTGDSQGLRQSTKGSSQSGDEVCFTSAEKALEAAETVKATGNAAFGSGKLDNALDLYQVASRHLSEARRLQTGK
jgi:hypothetical protein